MTAITTESAQRALYPAPGERALRKLWGPAARNERSVLPTMNQMIKDQIGQAGEPESEAAMRARYQADLWA